MKEYIIKLILLVFLNIYVEFTGAFSLPITILIFLYIMFKDFKNIYNLKNPTSLVATILILIFILKSQYNEAATFMLVYFMFNKLYEVLINKISLNNDIKDFLNEEKENNRHQKYFIYYALFILVAFIILFIFKRNVLYFDKYILLILLIFPINYVLNEKLTILHIYLKTRKKIKYKNIKALYKLFNANTYVFDKSKTILNNNLEIASVTALGMSDNYLINLVASLEKNIDGDIAEAFKRTAKRTLNLKVTYTKKLDGGYQINENGNTYLIGSFNLLNSKNIEVNKSRKIGTNIYISKNNKLIGIVTLKDNISNAATKLIKILKKLDKDILIISGDNFEYVKNISEKLGIDRYIADIPKEDKIKYLKAMAFEGEKICFIGSSEEDEELLKNAYVSIDTGTIKGYDIDINDLDELVEIYELENNLFKRKVLHVALSFIIRLLITVLYIYSSIDFFGILIITLMTVILNSFGILEPIKIKQIKSANN